MIKPVHIFVTGGTGFFGKALLQYWASGASGLEDAQFTLLSRDPDRFRAQHGGLLAPLDVTLVAGDIQNRDSLPDPRGMGITHVLHAATDSTHGLALKPINRYRQIVEGTENILDLALAAGSPRVLMTSSGGVYGPQPAGMERIPETYNGMPDPMVAENAYSVAKRMAEHLVALYHDRHGLEGVIARCFAFVGPDLPRDAHFAIGNFIGDVLAGRDIVIKGDGTPLRSYLDQRDLGAWLTAMMMRGAPQRAYNLGSDEAVSIGDLARIVSEIGGGKSAVRVLGETPKGQSAARNRYIPDIKRARDELGLQVKVDLSEAIHYTLSTARDGKLA